MKKIIVLAAAFAVASHAYAKKPPKEEAAPPPAVTYEMNDESMGEVLERICIAEPFASETYDSEKNMIIVAVADGGEAFLHLEGDCDVMTLMFATSASGGENGCFRTGDDITFSNDGGSAKSCKITQIHNWLPRPEYVDPYDY